MCAPWRGRSAPATAPRRRRGDGSVVDRAVRPRTGPSIPDARARTCEGRSVFEEFVVFLLLEIVDVGHVLVGEVLHLVQRSALVILGHLMVLHELLQMVVRVPPDLPDGIPPR